MSEPADRRQAKRYVLQCALRYRCNGTAMWREGRLRNMSKSGLLFDPQVRLTGDAQLEISIEPPPPGIGAIWCTAVVTRREAETQEVAARITDYRLMPRGTSADPGSTAI